MKTDLQDITATNAQRSILYPCCIRYFGTKLAGFPAVFDIPTTAIFFNSRILRISIDECESVFISYDYLITQ